MVSARWRPRVRAARARAYDGTALPSACGSPGEPPRPPHQGRCASRCRPCRPTRGSADPTGRCERERGPAISGPGSFGPAVAVGPCSGEGTRTSPDQRTHQRFSRGEKPRKYCRYEVRTRTDCECKDLCTAAHVYCDQDVWSAVSCPFICVC